MFGAFLGTVVSAVTATTMFGAAQPAPVLVEAFEGSDGTFASQDALWAPSRADATSDPDWLVESGRVERRNEAGTTRSDFLRVWSARTDLADSRMTMDVRFDGWTGGGQGWHGINLWLNASVCTPTPDCSAVDDGGDGPSGYALDFVNRDGSISIQKKVAGDTRKRWPRGAASYSNGGTYYGLDKARWTPVRGRSYELSGSATRRADGSVALVVKVDGDVVLEAVDSGAVGGPALGGGRVGLRTDFAAVTVDDIRVYR